MDRHATVPRPCQAQSSQRTGLALPALAYVVGSVTPGLESGSSHLHGPSPWPPPPLVGVGMVIEPSLQRTPPLSNYRRRRLLAWLVVISTNPVHTVISPTEKHIRTVPFPSLAKSKLLLLFPPNVEIQGPPRDFPLLARPLHISGILE